jgi:hypothetical protein
MGEHRANLRLGQHNGQSPASLRTNDTSDISNRLPQDMSVEEEKCAERLILRRRADVAFRRQVAEKGRNLALPHLRRMASIMENDESPYPVDVRGLRAEAVTARSKAPPNAFE